MQDGSLQSRDFFECGLILINQPKIAGVLFTFHPNQGLNSQKSLFSVLLLLLFSGRSMSRFVIGVEWVVSHMLIDSPFESETLTPESLGSREFLRDFVLCISFFWSFPFDCLWNLQKVASSR